MLQKYVHIVFCAHPLQLLVPPASRVFFFTFFCFFFLILLLFPSLATCFDRIECFFLRPCNLFHCVSLVPEQLQQMYTEAVMYSVASKGIVEAFVTGEAGRAFYFAPIFC